MKISSADTICLRRDAIVTECDGEVIALSIQRGRCYGMNRVGQHIWRKIGTPQLVSGLVSQTQAEFRKTDPVTSGQEIIDFLQQLTDEGLIEKVPNREDPGGLQ
jgi:hypothetical protein